MGDVRYNAPTRALHAMGDGTIWSIERLAAELGLSHRQAKDALHHLRRHSCALPVRDRFRLTDIGMTCSTAGHVFRQGGAHGDTVRLMADTLRQRAWAAMRVRRVFTVGDLVTDAARDEAKAGVNIHRFLDELCRAGVVRKEPRAGKPRAEPVAYRLLRNSGPIAPVTSRKLGLVHDFNTGEDLPCTARR